ncbi:hypothetical protein DFJ67_7578 [Asanoa ferruginea]|uniref:Uncharacterized protein n=1 Tax=Asanoa ferruginea TaxID=53367 RepID=A0A3D9ZZ87_9ACTN|nr:hypothetical protein DFJ67_7578 [Asanoa ferruginea]
MPRCRGRAKRTRPPQRTPRPPCHAPRRRLPTDPGTPGAIARMPRTRRRPPTDPGTPGAIARMPRTRRRPPTDPGTPGAIARMPRTPAPPTHRPRDPRRDSPHATHPVGAHPWTGTLRAVAAGRDGPAPGVGPPPPCQLPGPRRPDGRRTPPCGVGDRRRPARQQGAWARATLQSAAEHRPTGHERLRRPSPADHRGARRVEPPPGPGSPRTETTHADLGRRICRNKDRPDRSAAPDRTNAMHCPTITALGGPSCCLAASWISDVPIPPVSRESCGQGRRQAPRLAHQRRERAQARATRSGPAVALRLRRRAPVTVRRAAAGPGAGGASAASILS